MESTIIAAIIGAVATLLSVWLSHYLDNRAVNGKSMTSKTPNALNANTEAGMSIEEMAEAPHATRSGTIRPKQKRFENGQVSSGGTSGSAKSLARLCTTGVVGGISGGIIFSNLALFIWVNMPVTVVAIAQMIANGTVFGIIIGVLTGIIMWLILKGIVAPRKRWVPISIFIGSLIGFACAFIIGSSDEIYLASGMGSGVGAGIAHGISIMLTFNRK